jgi:hypothetical protein
MPFRHPDRSHDLRTRIDFEVRERLEEAVDYVCLEALVRDRRTRGLPPPAADSAEDRRAYTDNVLALLRRLGRELEPVSTSGQARPATPVAQTVGDEQSRLIAAQVVLARTLPDYWQRFEAISDDYLAGRGGEADTAPADATSGGEGRGLLARLFGRR